MNHHAYFIEGSQAIFEQYKEEFKPFYARQYEKFGIDEARELVSLASLKNIQETVFFLGLASITSEAQQALLKLFEEPQIGTTFILLVPHGILLPTLRSRMLDWISQKTPSASPGSSRRTRQESSASEEIAATFLKSSGKARSEQIAAMLKDEENTKERVRDFLNSLEASLAKNMHDKKVREGLADIAKVRSYLSDRSPALKMLLEHLAMSLPTL